MKQFREGVEFYYNDQGLIVLTEKFHRERGYCCGNGCKHCPFDYVNAPEPRRSQFLNRRTTPNNNSTEDGSTAPKY